MKQTMMLPTLAATLVANSLNTTYKIKNIEWSSWFAKNWFPPNPVYYTNDNDNKNNKISVDCFTIVKFHMLEFSYVLNCQNFVAPF